MTKLNMFIDLLYLYPEAERITNVINILSVQ